ncbi:MAG: hypothetical protein L0211_09285 [Planctomycetaceae bacterium]|nr:hypothetical protein [Planctomycetaceae bacterium]
MKRIHIAMTILGLAALCASGCKTFTPPSWAKSWYTASEPKVVESKYPRPVRLAVIWSPALLNTPGKKPTRGFGGRIYFYDAANKAVPVEGQLVVYGYDDSKTHTDGKTPDRKYAFTPEQFTNHFSETELGASYSVWLPWDEVGGPQMDISLVPMFTASSGQLVVGESSRNLLPGPTTENSATRFEHMTVPPAANGVQRATYEQVEGLPAVGKEPLGFKETSIRVPGTLAAQLVTAGPQSSATQQLAALRAQRVAMPNPPPEATRPTASSPPASWAAPPPSSPSHQPLARFVRPLHPAPSGPGLQRSPGPLRSPPFPAAQPFAPPASPMLVP